MHIGIDVSPLYDGHAGRGTGTYTRELIRALKEYETDIVTSEIKHNENVTDQIELIHYPYFDPFFLTLPIHKKYPTIVTVHDLIPLVFPEHFPRGVKGELKWQIQKKSLQMASAIITDSESSKKDIADIIHFDKSKIYVVYLAPSKKFFRRSVSDQNIVRKKYNLPNKFLLYVGDVNWNKNIPQLIHALTHTHEVLVLVGKAFLNETLPEVCIINKAIDANNLQDRVKKIGYVTDEELPAIYSAASVYIQPSLAEGFGLPVLEAMACGIPAVVSSTTSLQEIAGPSILVNPTNSNSIAEGITKALSLDSNVLRDESDRWLKKFTWEKVAKETAMVYKTILL